MQVVDNVTLPRDESAAVVIKDKFGRPVMAVSLNLVKKTKESK